MKNSKIISILASAVSVGAIAAGAFMFWKKKSQKEKSHLKHASVDSKTTDHERQDERAEKTNEHSKSSSISVGETTEPYQEGPNGKKSSHQPASHHEEKEEKKANHGKTAKKG